MRTITVYLSEGDMITPNEIAEVINGDVESAELTGIDENDTQVSVVFKLAGEQS